MSQNNTNEVSKILEEYSRRLIQYDLLRGNVDMDDESLTELVN